MTKKYIYGPGIDNPAVMIRRSGGVETPYYYYADALGSVRMLSDAAGDIAESYAYDPYGWPLVMLSAGADGNWLTEDVSWFEIGYGWTGYGESQIGNPYLFTGRGGIRWPGSIITASGITARTSAGSSRPIRPGTSTG